MLNYTFVRITIIITVVWLSCVISGCKKAAPKVDSTQLESGHSTERSESGSVKNEVPKILVVHSYYTDYEWVNAVNRGIRMVISPSMGELEFYYMDTKRRADEAWKQQKGREVLDLIEQWQPTVVITVDDNAQAYVGRFLVGKESPAVVFCGVNAEPEVYAYPASNVTGVLERLHFSQSVALLKEIMPSVQKIAVMSDDCVTSKGAFKHIRSQPSEGVDVVDMRLIKTFADWQSAVKHFSNTVDAIAVYTYHTLQGDGDDLQSVSGREVMNWTIEHSDIPVLGFLTFTIDDGSLCGVLESATEQGQLSAQLAKQILDGTAISELPVVIGTAGQKMVNLTSARKYQITIERDILKSVDLIIEE